MTMASSPPGTRPAADRFGGWLLTALFLIAAVLLFLLVYYLLPGSMHFYALLTIGVLALFLSLGSYLAESVSRDPSAQRSLAWGFFGMAFAVLFLTIGLGPTYGILSVTGQLFGLLVVVIVLFVTVALMGWRRRALRATAARQVPREAWRNEPTPSAFSYAAANSPSVPTVSPPPPQNPPPRSP